MNWLRRLGRRPKIAPSIDASVREGPLRVADFLSEKQIAFFHAGPSKQQVLGQLIGVLDLPDPSLALKAIMAREEAGSTVIAPGLALPHARLSGLRRLQAAMGLCPPGIVDAKSGGEPIHVFVLFLGPADNMKEHLAFLAAVSALFQRPNFVNRILREATPAGALALMQSEEAAS
jgi:mannitol/fructose-specific phosphotransferase system IIA component (Ntr-type)